MRSIWGVAACLPLWGFLNGPDPKGGTRFPQARPFSRTHAHIGAEV